MLHINIENTLIHKLYMIIIKNDTYNQKFLFLLKTRTYVQWTLVRAYDEKQVMNDTSVVIY